MSKAPRKGRVPARSPEIREQQMINLAVDLAERQLREGSASPSVITHYLKLATEKDRLERVKLEKETKLLEARTTAAENAASSEALYREAIEAFKSYSPTQEFE